MKSKSCTKCGEHKALHLFEKKKTGKHGVGSWCKSCKNKDRANYPRARKYKEYNLNYYYKNKSKWRELKARRRARELAALPNWVGELEALCIAELYQQAKDLSDSTGEVYEVDHILPLQGQTICGLHVFGNLQILTRTQNRQKANKYNPRGE